MENDGNSTDSDTASPSILAGGRRYREWAALRSSTKPVSGANAPSGPAHAPGPLPATVAEAMAAIAHTFPTQGAAVDRVDTSSDDPRGQGSPGPVDRPPRLDRLSTAPASQTKQEQDIEMIEIEQEAVEGKGKGKPATVKKPKAPIDPDAPKNARSAWLFFLEEIKRKEGHTKGKKDKTLNERWKEMTKADKKDYAAMAQKDKERYKTEYARYRLKKCLSKLLSR